MTQMFNPPHPGKVLREYLGDIDVTTAAKRLHVSRTTLSRILNGATGISADMSLRLSDALGTHASFWYDLHAGYYMWRASTTSGQRSNASTWPHRNGWPGLASEISISHQD